ncbi:MAG: hypothetical protein WCK13_05325 [Ignavibacteriota bacterium]|nr:hypothetical protein [Ignavibacteriota bacterium]
MAESKGDRTFTGLVTMRIIGGNELTCYKKVNRNGIRLGGIRTDGG